MTVSTWDYDDHLKQAKADLVGWEWGIDDRDISSLITAICSSAGSVVLQQISDDFRESEPFLNIEDGNVIIWNLSGDHFMVRFNATQAIRMWMEPGYIDNDARRLASSTLRALADEMDKAIESDPR